MNVMKYIHFPPPIADDMVRAILEGRKTVTRRVVKPQPVWSGCGMRWTWKNIGWWYESWDPIETITWKHTPYRPGDILYVRETWGYKSYTTPGGQVAQRLYKADSNAPNGIKWRPSIHMPREAARIFLRVTNVRVERLQDTTEKQAAKEGLQYSDDVCQDESWYPTFYDPDSGGDPSLAKGFSVLWNRTIKPADRALYGWDANPWVWVIAFERISKEEIESCR